MSWVELVDMLGAIDPVTGVTSAPTLSHSVPTPSGSIPGTVSVTFETPITYESYQNFTFDVIVSDLTGLSVVSFECFFTYNTALIENVDVNPAGITDGKSLTVNTTTPGEVQVAFADVSALSGAGTLFEVEAYSKVVNPPSQTEPLTWTSFQFNEGTPDDSTANGSITINANLTVAPAIVHTAPAPAINNQIPVTPSIVYVAPLAEPVISGQGFAKAASLSYLAQTPAFTLSSISATPGAPSVVHSAQVPTVGVTAITGITAAPSITYVTQDADAPNVGVAAIATITYQAQTPTEETFGTPRQVKLESFGAYAARLSVSPKVDDGIINTGETMMLNAVLRNSDGELTTYTGSVFFFVLKPDRTTVDGPYLGVVTRTGHYEAEYTPDEKGVYYLRFQDPMSDFIEERKFVVMDSLVEV